MSEPFRPLQAWAETMRTPAGVPDLEQMTPAEALEVWRDHGSCDSIGAEGWLGATEVLGAELDRLWAIEKRAIEIRDFPAQVPYPHPDWSRATDEAAVARQILEEES